MKYYFAYVFRYALNALIYSLCFLHASSYYLSYVFGFWFACCLFPVLMIMIFFYIFGNIIHLCALCFSLNA